VETKEASMCGRSGSEIDLLFRRSMKQASRQRVMIVISWTQFVSPSLIASTTTRTTPRMQTSSSRSLRKLSADTICCHDCSCGLALLWTSYEVRGEYFLHRPAHDTHHSTIPSSSALLKAYTAMCCASPRVYLLLRFASPTHTLMSRLLARADDSSTLRAGHT
jgi:hypothetical protein